MTRPLAAILICLVATGLSRAESASEILDAAGIHGGLIVHIGCGDGQLTADLHASDRFLVQGLDRQEANVQQARETIRVRGLYGKVSAELFDGRHLPYIDKLVNLLVVSDSSSIDREELLRVLCPGGVMITLQPVAASLSAPASSLPSSAFRLQPFKKPWPDDMDHWTHWLYGPGNNAVSHDRQVGVSRNLQWIMPPSWGRHHNLVPSMSIMVSANGRIYYIIDEAPISVRGTTDKWSLVCRDAFNGLVLWKKPIENWGWKRWSDVEFGGVMRFKRPDQLFRRLVAVDDIVYVTLGFTEPVVALDGATGEIIRQYKGTEHTSAILCKGDRLILARNVVKPVPGKEFLAIDAKTGEALWKRTGYKGTTSRGDELQAFMDAYLTVGDRNVFFINEDEVVSLDLQNGEEVWKAPRPEMEKDVFGHNKFNFINFCTLVYHDGRVFLGQLHPSPLNLNKWQQKDMTLLALDAASGRKLWEHVGMSLAHFTPPDVFVNDGLVWTMKKDVVSLLGLDVQTGEVRREFPVKSMLVGHHHRCYRNKATENWYLAGEEGIEYIDFRSGELDVHHWMRGACAFGILPANGLIYLPTHACGCHSNAKLHGFIALASREDGQSVLPRAPIERRLSKGPAYEPLSNQPALIGQQRTGEQGSVDWPTYKHDNRRSNHTTAEVPHRLTQKWRTRLGGRTTAPVIVGENVYVGGRDSHEVTCLNATTGEVSWQFTADGPVDTPPTIHRGKVLFGSRAGSVYALRAADGQLAWRFRAAPEAVQLMAFGRLESPWPLHGSILVLDDGLYCVAGRSMHLDSGMYVYQLDADTGRVRQETQLVADVEPEGEVAGAVLPDILVGDGTHLYMRNMRFRPDNIQEHEIVGKGAGYLRPNDGGLMETTWFNSAFWQYKAAAAQMLVFDSQSVYGIMAQNKLVSKSYGQDIFTMGDGYRIFRVDLNAATGASSARQDKQKDKKAASRPARRWEGRTSLRAQSMVSTPRFLFLAGAPDIVEETDPWGALEDRKGGGLEVYRKEDGTRAAEYKLHSTPIYDGMAAADGKLIITLGDGSIVCMTGVD